MHVTGFVGTVSEWKHTSGSTRFHRIGLLSFSLYLVFLLTRNGRTRRFFLRIFKGSIHIFVDGIQRFASE